MSETTNGAGTSATTDGGRSVNEELAGKVLVPDNEATAEAEQRVNATPPEVEPVDRQEAARAAASSGVVGAGPGGTTGAEAIVPAGATSNEAEPGPGERVDVDVDDDEEGPGRP